MNPEQLEAACREYCRLGSVDPDRMVPIGAGTAMLHKQWEHVRGVILGHHYAAQAIKFSLQPDNADAQA